MRAFEALWGTELGAGLRFHEKANSVNGPGALAPASGPRSWLPCALWV